MVQRSHHGMGQEGDDHQPAQRVHGCIVDVRGGVDSARGHQNHQLGDAQRLSGHQLARLLDGRTESCIKLLRRNLLQQQKQKQHQRNKHRYITF